MTAKEEKIAAEFKLTVEEVAQLMEVGLDTPRKIKAAKTKDLPPRLAAKLRPRLRKLKPQQKND